MTDQEFSRSTPIWFNCRQREQVKALCDLGFERLDEEYRGDIVTLVSGWELSRTAENPPTKNDNGSDGFDVFCTFYASCEGVTYGCFKGEVCFDMQLALEIHKEITTEFWEIALAAINQVLHESQLILLEV